VSFNFYPLNGHVLVRPLEPARVSRGGIHLPDNARTREAADKGVVVVRGESVVTVSPGDIAFFGRYGGTDLEMEGVTYRLVKADDLLGVVREGAATSQ
jgi:chaperonin GroES